MLTGKATTEVSEVTSGNPIEGQEYILQCDIKYGNPMTGESYKWKRDSADESETGHQLTIPKLDRDDHTATFTCAANNGAGMGEFADGLPLKVWCKLH